MTNSKARTLFLLVIAHPDDESMFFLPTMLQLIRQKRFGNDNGDASTDFKLLCLSNGDYDGLGEQREIELKHAIEIIGLTSSDDFYIDNTLKDDPKGKWPSDVVSQRIENFIEKNAQYQLQEEKESQRMTRQKVGSNSCKSIQYEDIVLITFDEGGVSGHKNHVDTHYGVYQYLQNHSCNTSALNPESTTVIGWKLNTMYNPLTKYFPLFTLLSMFFSFIWKFVVEKTSSSSSSLEISNRYKQNYEISTTIFEPWLVWDAMSAHKTQFVWYRRLSVIFSQYTYLNTLTRICITCDRTATETEDKEKKKNT